MCKTRQKYERLSFIGLREGNKMTEEDYEQKLIYDKKVQSNLDDAIWHINRKIDEVIQRLLKLENELKEHKKKGDFCPHTVG